MKTLFIGLGGFGTQVVSETKRQLDQKFSVRGSCFYLALDRDLDALADAESKSNIPCLHMDLVGPYGFYIDQHPQAKEIASWFPMLPEYLQESKGHGNGRFIGRLTFLEAMEEELSRTLAYLLYTIAGDKRERLRVVIVTSLTGSTGSGAFIQLALLLRKLAREFLTLSIEICGFFAGPELFIRQIPEKQRPVELYEIMRGNAHAALRELHWLNGLQRGTIPGTQPFSLDGLFSWPLAPEQHDIYDHIYFYDVAEDDGEKAIAMNEHIRRMAKSVCYRYASSATGNIDRFFRSNYAMRREQKNCFPINEDFDTTCLIMNSFRPGIELGACPIAVSARCHAAYQFACNQYEQESAPGPHLDKRWPRWLAQIW